MADFPSIVPTSRSFQPGDWPIKRFTSQNGSEVRILRGNSRVNSQLELGYDNISDTEANKFLTHYREVQGTFKTWYFPPAAPSDKTFVAAFKGWGGSSTAELETSPWGMAWRYAEPPQVTQVKRGISNVRLRLIGVLRDATTITSAASVAPIPPAPAPVPRFTDFYGIGWADSPSIKDVAWDKADSPFNNFAARKSVSSAYKFDGGKNTSPGLLWRIEGFAALPSKFEIICVDKTRSGASKIKSPYKADGIDDFKDKYLHWFISGPESTVSSSGGTGATGDPKVYKIFNLSDKAPDALPASWSASSLGSSEDSKKSSTSGWLGPYQPLADDPVRHLYYFIITALDASDKVLAQKIATSYGTWKF